MVHSKKLEETALWQVYQIKAASDKKRSDWVKDVYEAAANYMKDVRLTFQNYTLHDETHILNVMDAMGGLLGNKIEQLTVGEIELLILAASLHDLGMVYTEEEREQSCRDEETCRRFLREYAPELLGSPAAEWPENMREWYLRTLHPYRLYEVLQNKGWKELFDRRPLEVVPKPCMIAVCQAHGEAPEELLLKEDLKYLAANDAEPLFCALLLRLGDILDFDDTRAPQILYQYVACNEKSRTEWDKHQASAGFRYPASPSASDLPYKARCTNPGVEHAVRDFLDWVDEELGNCIKLQKYCQTGWQQKFPFPRAVKRDEIESDGYMSGDFCLTMDQTQVLQLLTGENLYDNTDVFVRELLQNAIDATLLRGRMEPGFMPEQSRIDLWEWNDKEGNIWFRIDDQGTGMTRGMLERYFLKVGNSYYNSRELERDLRDHGRMDKFHGISRFGIGFLSCFLCGDYAEVSTLYFDADKNRREEAAAESYQTIRYGLRLQVTGLSGYFTLKNQASHHQTDGSLPAPDGYEEKRPGGREREGYRANPGTSIVLRLEPGKLGALKLREVAEKYLCGARVPVYYNNERVGQIYEELMAAAHKAAGEKIYEMSTDMKEQFDRGFPEICGQYPKIAVSVIPLDTEENRVLSDLSGVLVKCDVRFDQEPQWKAGDQTYELNTIPIIRDNGIAMVFYSGNRNAGGGKAGYWEELRIKYESEKIAALEAEFEKYVVCPSEEEIAEVWKPFSDHMDVSKAWIMYHNSQQRKVMQFSTVEIEPPQIVKKYSEYGKPICVYQGIVAGDMAGAYSFNQNGFCIFLMERTWKPTVDISRTKVSGLPLIVLLAINGILCKHQMTDWIGMEWRDLGGWRNSTLQEWKKIKDSQADIWIRKNQIVPFTGILQTLQKSCKDPEIDNFQIDSNGDDAVIHRYIIASFQDQYRLLINYEEGQTITFCEKDGHEPDEIYDLFPPMMFCMAASDQSRRYICCKDAIMRRGITADHPFIIWLLNNAAQLKQYYQRQFQQIVDCLCQKNAEEIMRECNDIRKQLTAFPEHHGVEVGSFPQLSKNDFWYIKEN